MGQFGSRDEGLRLMNTGVAEFETLVKETTRDPGIYGETSAARARRADVELMRGDIAAARIDLHSAQKLIESLANLTPKTGCCNRTYG